MQSSMSICLISYDRYKMILNPIAYRNEESPRRAIARIAATWTFSILFYVPPTLFWDFIVGCTVIAFDQCDVEFRNVPAATITQAVVEFLIPLFIISSCNVRLLFYIRKRRKRLVDVRRAMEVSVGVNTRHKH